LWSWATNSFFTPSGQFFSASSLGRYSAFI
jgi:hypothetical protein